MKENKLQELEDLLENNRKLLPLLKDRYAEDVTRVKKDIREIAKEIEEYKAPKAQPAREYVTEGFVDNREILLAYEQLVSNYGEGVKEVDLLRKVNSISKSTISRSALTMRLYAWNRFYAVKYLYVKTGSGWGKVRHAFVPRK